MMMNRILPFATVALAMFAAGPALAANAPADSDESTHDGKVVSVTNDRLVMSTKDGKEHTHTLAKEAKLTCDGKSCKMADLKSGHKIRVTTRGDDHKVATHVEAIDKNKMFANTHDGKVISMDGDKLTMSDKDGKEHSHTIAKNAAICCDGKTCKMADLKAGMKIRVTTKASNNDVATVIEALDQDTEFGN